MDTNLVTAILTGGFALIGGIGGVILSGRINLRAERHRIANEDERRWLNDRRQVYSAYLALSESMLQQVDRVGTFLRYNKEADDIPEEDEEVISQGLLEYHMRWDDELQPALGEVQLMASPKLVDLAERVSGALLDVGAEIEVRGTFVKYYPVWFQVRDMIQVLRNEMRKELGMPEAQISLFPRTAEWPWLPDRPPRESYIQQHPRRVVDAPRPDET